MQTDTIADHIDRFMAIFGRYIHYYKMEQHALSRIRPHEEDGALKEALDLHGSGCEVRNELLPCGRALAERLEGIAVDSSPLLKVLFCADGGGGPAAAGALWPDVKVWLQRIAIRQGQDDGKKQLPVAKAVLLIHVLLIERTALGRYTHV